MPLEIELVKAQFKVWEYKWVETVGNPHWPYAGKATETYTYEYAMQTPAPHKMKLVLTHHVNAHPIPYLHLEVATANKKSQYQKPDIMNKPILIGSLLELKIINARIHGGGHFADEIQMEEHLGVAQIWQPLQFSWLRDDFDTAGNYWSARAHVEENVKAKRKYARKAQKFLRMECVGPVRRSERVAQRNKI
jgi:hypothetical protein